MAAVTGLLLAVVALALAAGCAGADASSDANALEVIRGDDSRVEFTGGTRAWCEDGILSVLGGRFPKDDEERPPAFWYISANEDELSAEEPIDLPAERLLFVYDPEVGRDGNDLSSAEEESTGSVTFREWTCEQGEQVRIDVKATLASEYHNLPSVDANGEVEAVVGDPVPIPTD
jgi:hypothetical protein